jgi:hypothetical protein
MALYIADPYRSLNVGRHLAAAEPSLDSLVEMSSLSGGDALLAGAHWELAVLTVFSSQAVRRPRELARPLPSMTEWDSKLAVGVDESRAVRRPMELDALARLASGMMLPSLAARGVRAIRRPLELMDLARLPASGGTSTASGSPIGLGGSV